MGTKTSALAYLEVAERLRGTIVTGRLAPDRRLPSESELAAKHGVGRSTIREALRQLSSQGLVVTTRGVRGGSRVARVGHNDVGRMLDTGITLLSRSQALTIPELVEVRAFLEVPAAGLAAARRGAEDLEALHASIRELDPEAGLRQAFAANVAFHRAILAASGNRALDLVTAPLFAVLETRFERDRAEPGVWAHVRTSHCRILRAIERGDRGAAERAMAAHLSRLRVLYPAIDAAASPAAGTSPRPVLRAVEAAPRSSAGAATRPGARAEGRPRVSGRRER